MLHDLALTSPLLILLFGALFRVTGSLVGPVVAHGLIVSGGGLGRALPQRPLTGAEGGGAGDVDRQHHRQLAFLAVPRTIARVGDALGVVVMGRDGARDRWVILPDSLVK